MRSPLQENAGDHRIHADILTERVLQVDNPIDGRTGVVVATANLGEFPGGYLSDKQVPAIMAERITTVAKRVRQRIDYLSKHLNKTDELIFN